MRNLPLLRERRGVARGSSDPLLRSLVHEVDNHDLVVVLDLQLAMQPGGRRRYPIKLIPLRSRGRVGSRPYAPVGISFSDTESMTSVVARTDDLASVCGN